MAHYTYMQTEIENCLSMTKCNSLPHTVVSNAASLNKP